MAFSSMMMREKMENRKVRRKAELAAAKDFHGQVAQQLFP
jgi:hypothetical protein